MKKKILTLLFLISIVSGTLLCCRYNNVKAADQLADGYYRIVSGNDSGYCLDIDWFGKKNGSKVQLFNTKTGGFNVVSNEVFYISKRSDGYYTIQCAHSGLYLHIQDERRSNCIVHCWEGGDHYNSHWKLYSAGNGYWYLMNRGNSSFMDNSNGNVANGNQIITYPFNGTPAQCFKLVKVNFDGSPLGWLDIVEVVDGKLHVKGWSFDWDNTDTFLTVAIRVGSQWYYVTANQYRPDVNEVYNGSGCWHGFDEMIDVGNIGTQQVFAYGINIGLGDHYQLDGGPKTVTIQDTGSTSEVIHDMKYTYDRNEENSDDQAINSKISIQQAMDEIVDRLEGKFFTVSGGECPSCKGYYANGHGCYNCLVSSIIKSDWYKQTFPEFSNVDVSHFPEIASRYANKSHDNNGYSCFGFGAWAQWYIYSRVYGEQDFDGQHHFAKGKMTYNFLKDSDAQPGDVIRRNGSHTMLLYSYDQNGYTIIDCNASVNGTYNCKVNKRTIKYNSSQTCVISRPKL